MLMHKVKYINKHTGTADNCQSSKSKRHLSVRVHEMFVWHNRKSESTSLRRFRSLPESSDVFVYHRVGRHFVTEALLANDSTTVSGFFKKEDCWQFPRFIPEFNLIRKKALKLL